MQNITLNKQTNKPLFIDSLWISHHGLQSHSSPCPSISTLRPSKLPKTKQQKTNNTKASPHGWVCHNVSYHIPFCPNSFPCKCSLQWVIGLVWGLWLLLQHQYGILSDILLLLCIIEILQHWICRAGPFIHSFWKFISGVVWANSNPGSGPGGSSTRCGGISLSSLVLWIESSHAC